MLNSVYTILGIILYFWYAMFRWTLFADESKYPWAYTPINLFTAFMSIGFILITLFTPALSFNKYMFWAGIFLFSRNIYYTIEDVIDFVHKPTKQQFIFVLLDIAMVIYTAIWIKQYQGI